MTDQRDVLDRLREVIEAPRDTHPWVDETGMRALAVHAIAAIEQRDQTIANLLDEKRRAMAAAGDPPQPERWEVRCAIVSSSLSGVPEFGHGADGRHGFEPFAASQGSDGRTIIWFRRRVTP
jgi:hypothetical protein